MATTDDLQARGARTVVAARRPDDVISLQLFCRSRIVANAPIVAIMDSKGVPLAWFLVGKRRSEVVGRPSAK
jgi:hypothetical protein